MTHDDGVTFPSRGEIFLLLLKVDNIKSEITRWSLRRHCWKQYRSDGLYYVFISWWSREYMPTKNALVHVQRAGRVALLVCTKYMFCR